MPELTEDVILLESNSTTEETLFYRIPGIKTISISGPDIEFFRQLQKLPAAAKIELMRLTPGEMETYCMEFKKKQYEKVAAFFKTKWRWLETGEQATFDADVNENCFGIKLTTKQILAKLKTGKLAIEHINKISEFFEEELYRQVVPAD